MTAAVWRLVTGRPWLSAAVAVVVIGGATSYAFLHGSSDPSAAAGVTTRLVSVSTGTVREAVSTTGTLTPADEADVSFGSSAEITSVRVTPGDTVRAAQVLGTIATVSLQASLAQARATLATAEANLASAEDDSASTDTQLGADRASVTSAKSGVSEAQDALDGATLRSPISGTVAEVNVSTGDESAGSSAGGGNGNGNGSTGTGSTGTGSTGTGSTGTGSTNTSSSSADFVVVGMKKWTVSATVDDTQVGLIAKNDQVQITTDNVTGTIFGTVSSVSVLSSGDSGSASYPVQIAVTGSPTGLHDGASATVSIIYRQVTNVLTVPSAALHSTGGASYVYVSKNGARTKATVTAGLSSGGTTQITSGLTSGEQVYLETVTVRHGTGGSTQTGTFPSGGFPGGGYFPGGGTGDFPGRGSGGFGSGSTGFGGGGR